MEALEIARVQNYMRKLFDNQRIRIHKRNRADDSAEVLLADEFIGVLYRDDDEGELSYSFQMAILDMDLED